MEDSFSYSKDKWDKSHANPDFKVRYLVLLSTTNLNKIKWPEKLKDSFSGAFVINALHGEDDFEVECSEKLSNMHPKFSASLIKPYTSGDAETFPLRNKFPQNIRHVELSGIEKITKVIKENLCNQLKDF